VGRRRSAVVAGWYTVAAVGVIALWMLDMPLSSATDETIRQRMAAGWSVLAVTLNIATRTDPHESRREASRRRRAAEAMAARFGAFFVEANRLTDEPLDNYDVKVVDVHGNEWRTRCGRRPLIERPPHADDTGS
jgi:hypothetical protein